MVNYSCGKEFSQKSHYDFRDMCKIPCENNVDKIKAILDKSVEEKLKELTSKKSIDNNEESNVDNIQIKVQPKKKQSKENKKLIKNYSLLIFLQVHELLH